MKLVLGGSVRGRSYRRLGPPASSDPFLDLIGAVQPAGLVVAFFIVEEPMPVEMSLLAADLVHNARVALDHVLARLKDHFGGNPGRGSFPTWQSYAAPCEPRAWPSAAPPRPRRSPLPAEIRSDILEHGVDRRGVLRQHYETDALDASTLLAGIFGFLPGDDARQRATVLAIEDDLSEQGFVLRYRTEQTDDGLSGRRGAFSSAPSGSYRRWRSSASHSGQDT